MTLHPTRLISRLAPLALVLSMLAPAAQGQSTPYRILVGFPAGGTIDVVARVLAEEMKGDLGAPVVVDSRPGAGGQIAAQALLQAPADGRTLLLSPDHTMVMLPLTVKAPGFKPQTDFAAVGQVARYPGGLAVASSVDVADMDAFFKWARANPGRANVGIPAPGSIPQFMVHLLGQKTGAPLVAVPYRGSAPLVQDLMAGQISAGTTALGDFLEPQAAGKMRVIGVLGSGRSPALPKVQTFAEQGYKIDWEYWLGLFAPAGTPPAEVARINAALGKALGQPHVRQRLERIEFHPAHSSPEALSKLVRSGTEFWAPVVRSSGFVPR